MDEERCRTDVTLASGTHYTVLEPADQILSEMDTPGVKRVALSSWTGSGLMPPTRVWIRIDAIVTVRELSEADWIWTKQATAAHYARQMADLETSAAQEMKRMVDAITRDRD